MTTPRGAALLHPDNGSVTRCHIEAAVRRIEEDAWPSGLAQDKVQRDRAMGGIDHDKDHAGHTYFFTLPVAVRGHSVTNG